MAEDKKGMTPEEFLELMYGGGKLREPTPEELDKIGYQMEQVAKRMKGEGPQQSGQPDT